MNKYELLTAIDNGNVDEVKKLAQNMSAAELNEIKDNDGYSLLMHTCKINTHSLNFQANDAGAIEQIGVYLIDKGADMNTTHNGHNAAYLASVHGYIGIVKKLYEKGFDFNQSTDNFFHLNPLEACLYDSADFHLYEEHTDIALYLLKNKAVTHLNSTNNCFGQNVLMMALQGKNLKVVQEMVDNAEMFGIDLTISATDGSQPLNICKEIVAERKKVNLTPENPDYSAWEERNKAWKKILLRFRKAYREAKIEMPKTISKGRRLIGNNSLANRQKGN